MAKQERAVHTRQSLIRAAAEQFEQHGYIQAKLSDISARAGVTPGALHFHFQSKATMAAAVETAAATTLRRVAQIAQRPGVNAIQQLISVSYALADRLRDDIVARAGLHLSGNAPYYGVAGELHREWFRCIWILIAQADEEGLLIPDVSRHDMATCVIAATTGIELLSRTEPEWLTPAALTDFWRLVLPCLAAPDALAAVDLRPSVTDSAME